MKNTGSGLPLRRSESKPKKRVRGNEVRNETSGYYSICGFLLLTGLTHLKNHSEAEAGKPCSSKSNKLLAQAKVDKKWGYIDKTGKIVIKPKFDWAGQFDEGLAMVELPNRFGYIDKTGKYVWEPTR